MVALKKGLAMAVNAEHGPDEPVAAVAAPAPDGLMSTTHGLLFYGNERLRQDIAASWVRHGLDRREKVLYTHLSEDAALLRSLTGRGVDTAQATADGRLSWLPLKQLARPSAAADVVAGALDDGYPRVRLLGHASAALNHVSDQEYQAMEQVMEQLCSALAVSVLCQYDAHRTGGTRLDWAVDLHPDVFSTGGMEMRRDGHRVQLTGDLDLASAPLLTSGLRRTYADQQAPVLPIDLSGVTFMDVAACRALLVGTQQFRMAGGTVSLENPRPRVRRILTLLRMDQQDGVVLVPADL